MCLLDLPALVGQLLEKDALGALSMAKKAGAVVTGFDSVAGLVESGKAIAILNAVEAAEDGRRKLNQVVMRATRDGNSRIAVISPFTFPQMDLALGRSHVIHAALSAASVARACLDRCHALLRYRGEADDGLQFQQRQSGAPDLMNAGPDKAGLK